jgi:hypothetical protein
VNQFHYRQEDQFAEASNSMKLKELYRKGDYTGLLELALVLNHQASFNNSKMRWAMQEALEAARPGNASYRIPGELKKDLESMGWKES